jgi:hypothetical protein
MKYPERVIVGAVRKGLEVSEFGHHVRLKAKLDFISKFLFLFT